MRVFKVALRVDHSTSVRFFAIACQPRSIDVIMTISLGFLYFFLSVGCFSVCW